MTNHPAGENFVFGKVLRFLGLKSSIFWTNLIVPQTYHPPPGLRKKSKRTKQKTTYSLISLLLFKKDFDSRNQYYS